MYLSRILFTFLLFLAAASGGKAQTVQDIVNKYLAAMGGKERLQSINSVYQEGVAVLDNGAELNSRCWQVYDRVYRLEINSPSGKISVVVTPRAGWSAGPGTGGIFKPLTPEQLKSLQPEIDPGGPLVDYQAKGNKLELAGQDTVNGHPCYKIRAYFPSGASAVYSIDAHSWYILRASHRGGNVLGTVSPGLSGHPDGEVSMEYGDYKVIPGGYVFPYTIAYSPYGAKIRIRKIEVNGHVDPDVLSKPK